MQAFGIRFLAMSLLVAAAACAKSGAVRPEGEIPEHLASYKQLHVEVTAKDPAHQRLAPGLQAAVTQHIKAKKWFQQVQVGKPAGEPGLRLVLQIVSYEGGNKGARAFNMGGEAKLVAAGQLLDNRNRKVLGRFTLQGSSLRESHVSVGGYDSQAWSNFDDLERRTLESAAEYLVKFLKDKMK